MGPPVFLPVSFVAVKSFGGAGCAPDYAVFLCDGVMSVDPPYYLW